MSNYAASDQEGERVLQFVVRPDNGRPIPVELRGKRISGLIADDHRVALVGPADLDTRDDRTLHPLKLKNLTTGGVVTVYRDRLPRKVLRVGLATLVEGWKSVIAAVVGALAVAVGLKGATKAVVNNPRTVGGLLITEAVCLALAGVAAYLLLYRRWRWQGGRFPLVSMVNGLIVTTIFAAALWWTYTR